MTATSTAVGRQVAAIRRTPAEAQRDFRTLLDVLARPGTLGRLLAPAGVPPVTVPVVGLADLEVPLAIVSDSESEVWARALEVATRAPVVPRDEARMVLALRPLTTDELTALPRGDALHPEHGTRLVQSVAGLGNGDVNLHLTGPGMPGSRTLRVQGLAADYFTALTEINAAFPAGIDVFLVADDGTVAGLPRSVTIKGAD